MQSEFIAELFIFISNLQNNHILYVFIFNLTIKYWISERFIDILFMPEESCKYYFILCVIS